MTVEFVEGIQIVANTLVIFVAAYLLLSLIEARRERKKATALQKATMDLVMAQNRRNQK